MRVTARERLTPHFGRWELACRCRRVDCDAVAMDPAFMQLLEAVRVAFDQPLAVTSGARCKHWNTKVGGAPKSKHLEGIACDFWFTSPDQAAKFAQLAEKHGFGGIGIGRRLIHLDGRQGAQERWFYQDK